MTFSCFLNINSSSQIGSNLGKAWRIKGKKCVCSYADLGVALTDIRRGTAKKISSEKLHYRKV
jgi:hypothetical protein